MDRVSCSKAARQSKAFGLINRFSEDIDITVFRADLGEPISLDELEALSGKKRRARLDAIKDACQRYVQGDLRAQVAAVLAGALRDAGLAANTASVSPDPADADGQTLLVRYPSIISPADPYVRPSVRIELGAKSALDPHVTATITPYVAADLESADLAVTGVTTIEAARTFWDKCDQFRIRMEQFDVTREQITAVLDLVAESLRAESMSASARPL
jgi:hypothetical protein